MGTEGSPSAFSFQVKKIVGKPFLHASCSSQISLDTSSVDKIRVRRELIIADKHITFHA